MSQYYWEGITDRLAADGWSYGYTKVITAGGGTVWNVDAYRRDGTRHFAQGDTLMMAFCEMEKVVRKSGAMDKMECVPFGDVQ